MIKKISNISSFLITTLLLSTNANAQLFEKKLVESNVHHYSIPTTPSNKMILAKNISHEYGSLNNKLEVYRPTYYQTNIELIAEQKINSSNILILEPFIADLEAYNYLQKELPNLKYLHCQNGEKWDITEQYKLKMKYSNDIVTITPSIKCDRAFLSKWHAGKIYKPNAIVEKNYSKYWVNTNNFNIHVNHKNFSFNIGKNSFQTEYCCDNLIFEPIMVSDFNNDGNLDILINASGNSKDKRYKLLLSKKHGGNMYFDVAGFHDVIFE